MSLFSIDGEGGRRFRQATATTGFGTFSWSSVEVGVTDVFNSAALYGRCLVCGASRKQQDRRQSVAVRGMLPLVELNWPASHVEHKGIIFQTRTQRVGHVRYRTAYVWPAPTLLLPPAHVTASALSVQRCTSCTCARPE